MQGKSDRDSNTALQGLLRNSDTVAYLKERKEQLLAHFSGDTSVSVEAEQRSQADVRRIIYDRISTDLVDAIKDGTVDYKQGAIIEKFMNKVLDYDDKEETKPEPPRIYLPENCLNCRYRISIEETDDTIDECKCCQYKKHCNEQGIEYDYKTQIIIKQEE
jgi:hypothetical protein